MRADASGALLHRRGYRQALAKAPLRETLAAAMLLASAWDPRAPLLDPLCGSGTIAIEAALLARNIAPGIAGAERQPRAFAFTQWPGFDLALWRQVVDDARAQVRERSGTRIVASDRNGGAIRAAKENAARAGVLDDIEFAVRPLSAVVAPAEPGWLVTNPPYGVRTGERNTALAVLAELNALERGPLREWRLALLQPERLPPDPALLELFATSNGGLSVRLLAR